MRASSFNSFHLTALAALSALVIGGCDKKPEAAPDAGAPVSTSTAAVSAAASASAAPVASASAKADERVPGHAMNNCPTAVEKADVAIKDIEGGVEVSVTAKDEAATKDIRERAKKSLDADKADGGSGHAQHNGQGSGGGTTGRCTIIQRNTKLTSAEIPGGVKMTVLAKDAKEVDWVRRETRERDTEAKSKEAVGAGAKRMAHCPSAVEGAKTTVKDTKDGVIVTVTGPADKLTEIRDRAKHTADVAKKSDPAKLAHGGEGTGGGAVGRCPIVVEGDTTVDLKEIATGIEATVTTKKDVSALQKEAKERAANFK